MAAFCPMCYGPLDTGYNCIHGCQRHVLNPAASPAELTREISRLAEIEQLLAEVARLMDRLEEIKRCWQEGIGELDTPWRQKMARLVGDEMANDIGTTGLERACDAMGMDLSYRDDRLVRSIVRRLHSEEIIPTSKTNEAKQIVRDVLEREM